MRKNKNVSQKHRHSYEDYIVNLGDNNKVLYKRCKICHRCIRLNKDNFEREKNET